jgi:hypothetical protein
MPTPAKVFLTIGFALTAGLLTGMTAQEEQSGEKFYFGMGFTLLVLCLGATVFFAPVPAGRPRLALALTLLGGGIGCFVLALALQFFLAYQSAVSHSERTAHLARLMDEGLKRGPTFNISFNVPPWHPPPALLGGAWFSLFFATALAAFGARIGLGHGGLIAPAPYREPSLRDEPAAVLPADPPTEFFGGQVGSPPARWPGPAGG